MSGFKEVGVCAVFPGVLDPPQVRAYKSRTQLLVYEAATGATVLAAEGGRVTLFNTRTFRGYCGLCLPPQYADVGALNHGAYIVDASGAPVSSLDASDVLLIRFRNAPGLRFRIFTDNYFSK